MFRIVSIVGFGATVAGITLHCIGLPSAKGRRWTAEEILGRLVSLLTLLFVEQRLKPVGVLRKLVYLLALLCFVVLAVTGLFPLLALDKHISGYSVMVHATFAPVFAVCLAVLAVMWSPHCHFTRGDWPWLERLVHRATLARSADKEAHRESSGLGQKITFWLIVVLALPLILSIVLSMFPLFGTHWQELLLSMHRYTALVFALVAIVHTYLLIRIKMQE
jgi:cytochrome b subunit of formate dehydrogenase